MKEKSAYVVASVVIFVVLTLVAHFMISLDWPEAVVVSLAAVVANIVVDALRHSVIRRRSLRIGMPAARIAAGKLSRPMPPYP